MQELKGIDVCWCNSENYTPGDLIKIRGKTGRVTEVIHQYLKTDIPGLSWINVITEGKNTVRGILKNCDHCVYAFGYSGGPYSCEISNQENDKDHTCKNWSYFRNGEKVCNEV
jgi:hypothetical protein